MEIQLETFLLISLIIAWGSLVQGSLGFGISLVATPFLVLIDPNFVPGPIMTLGMVFSSLIMLRERAAIDLSGLHWAVIGRLAGSFFAAWLVATISQNMLIVVFALIVLVAVVLSGAGLRIKINRRNLLVAGTLSGVMGTIAALGGPPVAILYQHEPADRVRTTLAGFFLFGTLASIAFLLLFGRFGWLDIRLGLLLLPGTLLGYALSSRVIPYLNRDRMRLFVLLLAALSSLYVLARQLIQI